MSKKVKQHRAPITARDEVETVDGRLYFTDDGWATVQKRNVSGMGGSRVVTGKEADLARLLAAAQSSAGRY